jgi:transcriptional enhancer factor
MEHWHTSNSAPYHAEGAHSAIILTSSSGNAQAYALDSKEGIENQNPFTSGRFSTKQESKTELHFPVPKLKLGSNDHYAENLLRLQARRQHNREKVFRQRRSNPERPYLQHPTYLQYRARQRCDTGADGKPVWDDRIEDAFQNGLS